jgi:hypothetical protein
MDEQSKHHPAEPFTLRRIWYGAHSTEKGQAMSSGLTKRDSHWIGGVVTMAAVLGAVIGLGTESYLWGGIVTLVVGSAMVAVIAMME